MWSFGVGFVRMADALLWIEAATEESKMKITKFCNVKRQDLYLPEDQTS
jgi:hypothetical protein